jgi:hypothetical protein
MAAWRWAYLDGTDLVFCETDRPDGAKVPLSAEEQAAAGQLTLLSASTPEGATP